MKLVANDQANGSKRARIQTPIDVHQTHNEKPVVAPERMRYQCTRYVDNVPPAYVLIGRFPGRGDRCELPRVPLLAKNCRNVDSCGANVSRFRCG